MLHFILGTAGSGKSFHVLEQMKQALSDGDQRVLLLVPEQFSFETERRIYREFPKEVLRRIEVVSFIRLANSVFRRYGGLAGSYADASDKMILMNMALDQVKDGLETYRRSSAASLTKCMLDAVNEFKTWGITSQQLFDAAAQLEEGHLKRKLSELSLIYAAYEGLLGRAYLDPLDDIARAGELLKQHTYFKDTVIFIDEFDGFTANENAVLKAMLRQSADVTVALCMPNAAVSDKTGLFATVKSTFNKVVRFANECGVPVAKPTVLEPGKRFISREISHLEQHVLSSHTERYSEECRNIKAFSASNAYEEVEFVLATVKHLVREEGYRYRDIVITARDLTPYQDILKSGFQHYEIPFFMDMLSSVAEKPLIRFISSLLAAALGNQVQDILNLLKCDVMPYTIEEISVFENYLYTWNLRGTDLAKELIAHPRGFQEHFTEEDTAALALVNRIRSEVMDILTELRVACSECDGYRISTVLYELLERLEVRKRTQELAEALIEQNQDQLAEECVRVWGIAMEILDSLASALHGIATTLERYLELYQLIAANYQMGEIPQRLDSVTVGSSERIRTANPRAVFILGLNDGVFPYVPTQNGLLTDVEKKQLEGLDLQLSRSQEEMILQERFLAYKAMTAASERLYLSYPRASAEGKPAAKSFLVDRLLQLFGEDCKTADEDYRPLYYCQTEQTAFSQLARHFREDSELRHSLEAFLQQRGHRDRIGKLYQMLRNKGFKLEDKQLAAELFGKQMRISASRFERFQKCKFLYFCEDGLRAEPRRKAELNALESGTLVHTVIYALLTGDKPLAELSDEELKAHIRRELDLYIEAKMGGSADKTDRFLYLYRRLSRMLFQIAVHLREEMQQSAFVPTDFELQIGRGGPVDALKVLAPDGTIVQVEGRIDRVDVFEKDGVKYVRVIDYKTGEKKFELSDVFYGVNMQMLLYLFSIWDTKSGKYQNCLPAGVLYLPARQLEAEYDRNEREETIADKSRRKYCMSGLVLEDESVIEAMEQDVGGIFIPVKRTKASVKDEKQAQYDTHSKLASLGELGKLKRYAEKLIGKMAQELHDGNIEAVPLGLGSMPCTYCSYHSVCGRPEDGARIEMQKFDSKQAIFEEMEEVLADE